MTLRYLIRSSICSPLGLSNVQLAIVFARQRCKKHRQFLRQVISEVTFLESYLHDAVDSPRIYPRFVPYQLELEYGTKEVLYNFQSPDASAPQPPAPGFLATALKER